MSKNKIVTIVVFCIVSSAFSLDFSAFSKNSDASWSQMEKACVFYEGREYGESLGCVLDAVKLRSAEAKAAADILKAASRTQSLKRIGDDLVRCAEKFAEREDDAANKVVREVFTRYSSVYFGNSLKKLILWLDGYQVYPEALFLQGQIYQAEGEYQLAESLYLKALENEIYFDIREDKYSVLYALADLSRFCGNTENQEKYLLRVLVDDSLCAFDPVKKTMQSAALSEMSQNLLTRSRTCKTTDSYFLLYRHDAWFALKAYQDLAKNYYHSQSNDPLIEERAFICAMLASSIIVTNLNQSLLVREVKWSYTDFPTLFERIALHPDIMKWTNENKIWETLYYFGLILEKKGNPHSAKDFFKRTAPYCSDSVWQQRYILQYEPKENSNVQ